VKLIKSGVDDKTVAARIQHDGVGFPVDAATIGRLRRAGASERVLAAVRAASSKGHSASPITSSTPATTRPGGRLPGGPVGPQINSTPIYETQQIVLDMLPVCVVYAPPGGQQALQDFRMTNRFGAETTITSITTQSQTLKMGLKLFFVSGSQESQETSTYDQTTKTWKVVVNTSGWQTDPTDGSGFPGAGDKIVFYRRPKFELKARVANLVRGTPGGQATTVAMHPPQVESVRPVFDTVAPANPADRTWVQVVATVREIRQGVGNAQGTGALRDRLLALDPFAGASAPGPGGFHASQRPARLGLPAAGAATPGTPEYPASVRNSPRFVLGEISYQWYPSGNANSASTLVETGALTSTTTTNTTRAKVNQTVNPTFSTPYGSVSPLISVDDELAFSYTINQMTSTSSTTDAEVWYGGGDGTDDHLYLSDVYYDATFGTLLLTRQPLDPNAQGTVQQANGSPAPSQRLLITDPHSRRSIVAVTDRNGKFAVELPDGPRTITAIGKNKQPLSDAVPVALARRAGKIQQLGAIRLRGTGSSEAPHRTSSSAIELHETTRLH
jgi:hypothetical protein